MAQFCRVLARAKVNIGLNVFHGAIDGYHALESVFQTVGLCDMLEVERQRQNGVVIYCGEMELPAQNTLTETYHAFCAETGIKEGARVVLKKHIPQGAGLGGGSSDAAAFVGALETLFCVSLDGAAKTRIASRVGSDVFFFLLAQNISPDAAAKNPALDHVAAVVTGRGQQVKSIAPRNDLFFLLVFPGVFVSTKEAFSLLDECEDAAQKPGAPRLEELESMYYDNVESWSFVNSFTGPVSRRFPRIAQALVDVRSTGALFADMSGSGSTVFGVYVSREKAYNAFARLKQNWQAVCAWEFVA